MYFAWSLCLSVTWSCTSQFVSPGAHPGVHRQVQHHSLFLPQVIWKRMLLLCAQVIACFFTFSYWFDFLKTCAPQIRFQTVYRTDISQLFICSLKFRNQLALGPARAELTKRFDQEIYLVRLTSLITLFCVAGWTKKICAGGDTGW